MSTNGEVEKFNGQLDEVDAELLRLRLEKPSTSYREMAPAVGLSEQQIWRRCSRAAFREAIAEKQSQAIEILLAAREQAARRLIELINSEHEPTALKACVSILADALPEARMKIRHEGLDKIAHIEITVVHTEEVPQIPAPSLS